MNWPDILLFLLLFFPTIPCLLLIGYLTGRGKRIKQ